ncbi:MAG: heme lyase CcmF/NrfE family subunit [Dehalococcoidia bacterium]|nr:heme lyase CcmF/NrfE family subunit [Dehalococcoidia bacterium]
MAETGSVALYIALMLAAYAVIGSVLGKLRHSFSLVESAQRSTYLVPLALGVATAALMEAFLRHDFQVEYVAAHSNLAMNPIYTWVAFYAGNEGSLLYVALVLSLAAAVTVAVERRTLAAALPYTTAILMSVVAFFMGLLVTMANPFDLLPFVPADGQGINPLLTHPGMFIHPPMIMTGLIGVSVPFSIAMGTLLAGGQRDEWVEPMRVWGLLAWVILGSGVLLGAWWAYTILGWGGYWGWDPIENVALMPWLVLTAFLHSIMAQKRRGMFRMWNIALISIAFILALFGIFINRGGPVPSVHSFASSTMGWVFLGFLGVGLAFSLTVFFFRYNALSSRASLDSMLSREAAFLLNNVLLLGIACVTLWGVIYPLVSQLFRGVAITVGAPFYNQVNGPLFLALIFLMGVGPLLPWRHASAATLRNALQTPTLVALATLGVLVVLGIRKPFALASFGLCSVIVTGIIREWVRGTMARRSLGENYALAFGRLIAANRPRYGGYIVHLAIVVLALGITGYTFYRVQKDVILGPGESATVGEYTIQFVGSRALERLDRTEFFNDVLASRSGEEARPMTVWRAYYPDKRTAATRAAIRSTPVEDLYIVSSESLADGRVAFRIQVNPLVWWMWIAGPLLILGTVVSLWSQPRLSLAAASEPAGMALSPAGSD